MYFAQRTRNRILVLLAVLGGYVLLVVVLATVFPGESSLERSFVRWLVGIPFVLVLWAALEFAGTKFLSARVWATMHPALRVVALVLLVALIVAVVIVVRGGVVANAL